MPDAVLLDMDGTLVDSDAAVTRAWAAWGRAYDVAVDPQELHGRAPDGSVRALRPDLDDAAVAEGVERLLALQYTDVADVTPLPGAAGLLALLDELRVPWAVVTSADTRLARARLEAAGLPARELVTVEDVSRGKPDPQPYLVAARRLGVDPARCLVVEDAEAGIASGRAAGATVVALRGLAGDLLVSDLEGLIAALRAAAATGPGA